MAMGANATELSELSAVGVQLSACRAGAFENPVVVQVFFDDAERSPGYHTFGSRAERRRQPSRRVRSGGSRLSARRPRSRSHFTHEAYSPGVARLRSSGPFSRTRTHRPVRTRTASPGSTRKPAFFSQASRSST